MKVQAANKGKTVSVVIPLILADEFGVRPGSHVEWTREFFGGHDALILRKIDEVGNPV